MPSASIARWRITPVVVSSVPPMTSARYSRVLRVQHRDHIGAVVDHDVRPVLERGVDVLHVGLGRFALDREDRDAVLDQRGGDIVLGRERVGGAEHGVGAAGLQRQRQVGRLGGDVGAGDDAVALEGLLPGEPLADQRQHRHLARRPVDPLPPERGQRRDP